MSKHENEYMNAKQVATTEASAAAMLDRDTEARLYRLYRAFFRTAEDTRNWNVWTDIPWDRVTTNPGPELVQRVIEAYREDLMLPDYAARTLQLLRASRGRAWFVTRWSYEEGKHLLALHEWLIRSGAFPDDELRQFADETLNAYGWEPPYEDPIAVVVDAFLWELREKERGIALLQAAEAAGDGALIDVLKRTLLDEEAHRRFLAEALGVISENYPEAVRDAVNRVAAANEHPGGAAAVMAALGFGA